MPGFTRQIILHTLTELMNEKPLSKITVKDIVERCGVNRNTFYYHFRDIPDAVEAMVKEELNDILKDQKVPESVSDCMEILVNAVQKNKKAMIHLYRSIQRDVFADYLDHAAENLVVVDAASIGTECGSPKVMNVALLGAAIASGLIGISLEEMEAAIEKRVPEKFKDMNMKALKLGAAASAMIR